MTFWTKEKRLNKFQQLDTRFPVLTYCGGFEVSKIAIYSDDLS